MNNDIEWMEIALNEANNAYLQNEVPIGAVIIRNDKLIAKAHNQPIALNDPTAHAEIQVIKKAGAIEKNYRLLNTTLYVTLEPCLMCLGAIIHARIDRIVYGASDSKNGVCGSINDLSKELFFNHQLQISKGVKENECKKILKDFFEVRRV
jgi:tRNA(adenine34) deaminase